MPELRIGTCSWKYPSWHGLVYSAPKGINYLAEYARRYNTVEVDQWFWSLFGDEEPRLPRPDDVAYLRQSVPDDFRFSVKVPNSITLTHFYTKAKTEPLVVNPHFLSADLFAAFLASLDPIADVLGPLIFQFEYLNRRKMASQSEFQERLERFTTQLPPGRQYAVEIRNGNYLNEAYLQFLDRNRLTPVFLLGYWMPAVSEVYTAFRPLILRQDTVVIRLHGPDRDRIEKETGEQWDRIVAPRDAELAAIAAVTQEMLGAGQTVYLNVNNHFEGSAPLTIERIRAILAGGSPEAGGGTAGGGAEPRLPGL